MSHLHIIGLCISVKCETSSSDSRYLGQFKAGHGYKWLGIGVKNEQSSLLGLCGTVSKLDEVVFVEPSEEFL